MSLVLDIPTMRLTQKKIEEILISIIGEDGLPLLYELQRKDNISEFDLASKTKKDIKVIRKMLYFLYNHNLVSFMRKKDKVKGWYIYYWTILPENIRYIYIKLRKNTLARLQEQLETEKKELFFSCKTRCVRLNFDQGMEFEFHCPECGDLLAQDSSQEKLSQLHKAVQEAEQELAELLRERKKEKRKAIKKEVKIKQKIKRKNKMKKKIVKK